eukprot:1597226-Pleurochrysis_carterae.AAC.7
MTQQRQSFSEVKLILEDRTQSSSEGHFIIDSVAGGPAELDSEKAAQVLNAAKNLFFQKKPSSCTIHGWSIELRQRSPSAGAKPKFDLIIQGPCKHQRPRSLVGLEQELSISAVPDEFSKGPKRPCAERIGQAKGLQQSMRRRHRNVLAQQSESAEAATATDANRVHSPDESNFTPLFTLDASSQPSCSTEDDVFLKSLRFRFAENLSRRS